MTVARELANFLTGGHPADLPPQALDHAAMLIASTHRQRGDAGRRTQSARIISDMAREPRRQRAAPRCGSTPAPSCRSSMPRRSMR